VRVAEADLLAYCEQHTVIGVVGVAAPVG